MKRSVQVSLVGPVVLAGLIFSGAAEAKPAGVSKNSTVTVTAEVPYVLDNYASPGNMAPPVPVQADVNAALSNPDNAGQTVVITPTSNTFSVYSNGGGTPLYIQAANTTGAGGTSTSTAKLTGTDNTNVSVPYHINYTPCGASSPTDLTTCQSSTSCPFTTTLASCKTTAGTVTYSYAVPNDVVADEYNGATALTYSIGL